MDGRVRCWGFGRVCEVGWKGEALGVRGGVGWGESEDEGGWE